MSAPTNPREPGAGAMSSDDLIDVACDEFEAALRAGQPADLREFLSRVEESVRSRLFTELLYVEFEFRPPPAGVDPKRFYVSEFPTYADEIRAMTFDSLVDTVHFDRPSRIAQTRPRSFARFELEKRLGAGAVGEVWMAYDPQLDRHVAVKIPRNSFSSDEEAHRFLREGRAAAQLRHANIVPVHEVAHAADAVYIVSEYIEGGDLRTYLDSTSVTYRDAAELCETIAGALHYAHNRGIVHRDLKPANVLMDADHQPHIADFGLAKWTKDAAEMTATGQVLGTPAYMSPEQARGRAADVDRRCDVYSVGVMLYEMITGRVPFSGDLVEILRAIADDPPKEPRSIRRDIPRDLATICMKAMEKDPRRRYDTALELADDLNRFLADEPIRARRVALPERWWRWCKRRPAVAASIVLSAIVLFAGWIAYREWDEKWRAADIRTVTMDTDPSGAEIVFVPLDDRTGLPEPNRLIQGGRSPVKLGLAPADYLVVAAHANGKFHEVHRHVPRSDEGLAGALNSVFYVMEQDGTIRLVPVKLWASSEIRGMERIEISSTRDGLREELLVDVQEMLSGDVDDPDLLQPYGKSPTEPIVTDFYSAMVFAEQQGKRLPTAPEFERILDTGHMQRRSRLVGLFTEPWEWSSTSVSVTFSTNQGYGGPAESGGRGLVYGGSQAKLGRSIEKIGGNDTAAVRAVRSVRPRLTAADFLALEMEPETMNGSPPSQTDH